MDAFKILGIADEGKCECCGANCPKRRVLVQTDNGQESWGVICASKARGGRGTATDIKHLSKFAEFVGLVRDAMISGRNVAEIKNRNGFPMDIRENEVRIWTGYHRGPADAVVTAA